MRGALSTWIGERKIYTKEHPGEKHHIPFFVGFATQFNAVFHKHIIALVHQPPSTEDRASRASGQEVAMS